MCCLPFWPVRDIILEDVPDDPMFQYVWDGKNWVPTVSGSVSVHTFSLFSLPRLPNPLPPSLASNSLADSGAHCLLDLAQTGHMTLE